MTGPINILVITWPDRLTYPAPLNPKNPKNPSSPRNEGNER